MRGPELALAPDIAAHIAAGGEPAPDRARAMVIGGIQARLPAGSDGAFTVEELALLAPFSPYE